MRIRRLDRLGFNEKIEEKGSLFCTEKESPEKTFNINKNISRETKEQ